MIILRLDMIMAREKISLQNLSETIGITNANLSNIKNGKIKAIRFSTLNAICRELNCQPGDILEYRLQSKKNKNKKKDKPKKKKVEELSVKGINA